MATMDFSNIPEVFYNNEREKYIYLNDSATPVWPYEENITKSKYELTGILNLVEGDIVTIIFEKSSSYYQMNNDNGTSSPPDANTIEITDNVIEYNIGYEVLWIFHIAEDNSFYFESYNAPDTYLYCNSSNNRG